MPQEIKRVRVLSRRVPAPVHDSADRTAFRGVAFATKAITTIVDGGAHDFTYDGGLRITFHCVRSLEQHRIREAFPRDRAPGLTGQKDFSELGISISCDERQCSLFPIDGKKIECGERYVHFLIRFGSREMLVSVSVNIRPITRPSVARFTRNLKVDAALAVFRTRMDAAHNELAEEIRRIVEIEVEKAGRDEAA